MTHLATDRWELHQLSAVPDKQLSAAEIRELSHVRALTDLFGRRPDLAGVYPPADVAAESVCWSA
jgi:hypothetical protein